MTRDQVDSDPDELIDAAEVARILGLAHRNSVSTYRSRYPDFPVGRPSPAGGRTLLWNRGDILAWRHSFTSHRHSADDGNPRLDELVDATARLMLRTGSSDVSIRQIAAEAGVAHSDLYRYATSKDHLRGLAVEQINREFAESMPATLGEVRSRLPELLRQIQQLRPAMVVIASETMAQPGPAHDYPIAVELLAELIAARRQDERDDSPVDPEVVALCVGALIWGFTLLSERWRVPLGLEEVPIDQVARVVGALLDI